MRISFIRSGGSDIVNGLAIFEYGVLYAILDATAFPMLCAHIEYPVSFSHSLCETIHHRICCTLAILCNIKTTSGPAYPSLASSLLPTTASLIKLCNRANPVFSVLAKNGEANRQHGLNARIRTPTSISNPFIHSRSTLSPKPGRGGNTI
jgi:hypothetical protein